MSLVIIISLSSFFVIDGYREKIAQATISFEQLSRLDSIEFYTDSNKRLSKLLITENEKAWLHLAQMYAKNQPDIAYQLGQYYLKKKLNRAAELWLKSATRQNHQDARLRLASHYFEKQQYQESKDLLLAIIENKEALVLLYKLAIQLGDTAFITKHQSRLAALKDSSFYQQLANFSIFNVNKIEISKECHVSVQLFATNLAGLQHGEKLISQFQQHKLSAYVCLQTPKYIPREQVNCQTKPQKKISCEANVWATRTDISSRYIGLIVEQGGANVDNGIMYIDQQDGVEVLAHEISHFVGFIDEYPLPILHQKCASFQQKPFSHNLVTLKEWYVGVRADIRKLLLTQLPWASLIKDTTPILTQHGQGWKLATPLEHQNEVGVFLAHSCDKNANVQGYKPYYSRTQLEYFELTFPQTYIDILSLAPKQYLMPSYHFNISRDLVHKGEHTQAKEVLRATIFH